MTVEPVDTSVWTGVSSPGGRSSAARSVLVERGDAVVVEARCDRAEHGHVGPLPRHLPPDVAQRVGTAAAVELVDRHRVGEVEHVDLLELARGAELGRHDVERDIRAAERCRRRPARFPAFRRSRHRSRRPCTHRSLRAGHPAPHRLTIAWRATGRTRSARRSSSSGCGHPGVHLRLSGASDPRRGSRPAPCPPDRVGAGSRARRSATTCPTRPCR